MAFRNPSDEAIRDMLADARTLAVVGASSNPSRPSHGVFGYLLRVGYHAIPVNPREREVAGVPAVARLADIGEPVDIVIVFRRAEETPPVAREAVAIGAKALWLQLGIVHEEAARVAEEGGLRVVMDLCSAVEHRRLGVTNHKS